MVATVDVLVVDDSALMRRIITTLLESDPRIRVVATAADGFQAIDQVASMRPDVVVMDIQMPNLDGLGALQHIMQRTPTPVVILSGVAEPTAAVRSLELGAVEFVAKPSGTISIDLYKVRDELVNKVKLATLINLRRSAAPAEELPPLAMMGQTPAGPRPCLVAIAASTGGPQTLDKLLQRLPADLPAAVLVVQHMPVGFTASFARRLDQSILLPVREGEDGQEVKAGHVYVAPGGRHMVVIRRGERFVLQLLDTPPVNSVRPSADVMMESVAELAGGCSIGVVLTGMGRDGTDGLGHIRQAGGVTIAQDKDTSTIFGMPKAAIGRGVVDQVLPLGEIPDAIVEGVKAAVQAGKGA